MSRAADVGPLGEVVSVKGESFVISGPDGDIVPGGDQGLFVRDTRFLDRLELTIDGEPPRTLAGLAVRPATAAFHLYVPRDDDRGVDPTLLVTRRRALDGSLHEEVELDNRSTENRTVEVALRVGTDLAYIFDVKHARQLPQHLPLDDPSDVVRFGDPDHDAEVVVRPSPEASIDLDTIRWSVPIPARGTARVAIDVETRDVYGSVLPARRFIDHGPEPDALEALGVEFRCSDERFERLLRRSIQDVASLQLPDPEAPDDRFCAAGSPWYLTLFGRDALWTAWMMLPFDLGLAAGTLKALARRQGKTLDPETEEAPGKILHEIRRGGLAHRGDLPPNYYGTIDATPLFVLLLHDAWRWGLDDRTVRSLLPNLEAALAWMRDHGDADGDGLLEYRKQGERGLDNQGWKDSFDGIQFADGRLAKAPISLVEVQAYACAAAERGAALLDRFDRPDADEWRSWAKALERRLQERYWVSDDLGRYLAMALDADGVPVDAPASNMGHVLAMGLLRGDDATAVAQRLADPTLASGWGLRTMATTAAGYNPLSYHGGSVWPHDTAIAAWGCALAGERDAAATLAQGLVAAAPFFRYRLPELFAGIERTDDGFPVPYPASCRPQAWSAAGALLLLRACLRPTPDLPDGRITFAPLWPPLFRHLEVRGIPLAGGRLDVVIDKDRGVRHELRGADLEVVWQLPADALTTSTNDPGD